MILVPYGMMSIAAFVLYRMYRRSLESQGSEALVSAQGSEALVSAQGSEAIVSAQGSEAAVTAQAANAGDGERLSTEERGA